MVKKHLKKCTARPKGNILGLLKIGHLPHHGVDNVLKTLRGAGCKVDLPYIPYEAGTIDKADNDPSPSMDPKPVPVVEETSMPKSMDRSQPPDTLATQTDAESEKPKDKKKPEISKKEEPQQEIQEQVLAEDNFVNEDDIHNYMDEFKEKANKQIKKKTKK